MYIFFHNIYIIYLLLILKCLIIVHAASPSAPSGAPVAHTRWLTSDELQFSLNLNHVPGNLLTDGNHTSCRRSKSDVSIVWAQFNMVYNLHSLQIFPFTAVFNSMITDKDRQKTSRPNDKNRYEDLKLTLKKIRIAMETDNVCEIKVKVCKKNYYGDCTQKCNCFKGDCTATRDAQCIDKCASGYRGYHCQIGCTDNTFGSGCSRTCHCEPVTDQANTGNSLCSTKTGFCKSRRCQRGYMSSTCSIKVVKPHEVNVLQVMENSLTSSSVKLGFITWKHFDIDSYLIIYRVNYKIKDHKDGYTTTDFQTNSNYAVPVDPFHITNLRFDSTYEAALSLQFKFVKSLTEPTVNASTLVYFRTKCKEPSSPKLTTLKREDQRIIIQWQKMEPVDMNCRGSFNLELQYNNNDVVNLNSSSVEYIYEGNSSIFFQVRLRSINQQKLASIWTSANLSAESNIVLVHNRKAEMDTGAFVVIVAVFFACIVVISGVAFGIYRRNASKYKSVNTKDAQEVNMNNSACGNAFKVNSPLILSVSNEPENKCYDEVIQDLHPVKLSDLEEYVMKRQGNDIYEQEYKSLPEAMYSDFTFGKLDINKPKNRFLNIIPFDHSRVTLDVHEKHEGDYINANYINNYQDKPEYIAAQGCTKYTCEDMWRMVWQENCYRIVMTTNLIERGKRKCECYWPNEIDQTKTYGHIKVLFSSVEKTSDFIIRNFKITNTRPDLEVQTTRDIKQFHFTGWPDHGVPIRASPIIKLRNRVWECVNTHPGVVIVHCSAGVGRTGSYIAIDTLLEQAKNESQIDIYNFTLSMRHNRINMIQTLDQYIFVHDALLEMIVSANTLVTCSEFPSRYQQLLTTCETDDNNENKPECDRMLKSTGEECSLMKIQYEQLNRMSLKQLNLQECRVSLLPQNASKNRHQDIIASDRYRPFLNIRVQGTNDYINAAFLDGPWLAKAYVITQMPLPHTVIDFWRMVFEMKSSQIVMLNTYDPECSKFGQYWPEDEACECGPFIIEPVSVSEDDDITTRVLGITYKTVETSTKVEKDIHYEVTQYQLTSWPNSSSVPSCNQILVKLTELLERTKPPSDNSPVVIHCLDGQSQSGVFATICSLWQKMKVDHDVDIFHTVKHMRNARPGIITSLEQYKFCHEMVLSYLEEFNTYSNFR